MQERLSKLITAKSFWYLVLKAINFMTDNIIERKTGKQNDILEEALRKIELQSRIKFL